MLCPAHNKAAHPISNGLWKCNKCYKPFIANWTGAEYDACKSLEAKYRELDSNVQFLGNEQTFFEVMTRLCYSWHLPVPRLQTISLAYSEFNGVYISKKFKNLDRYGIIELKPLARIVTMIHELTHHFVHLEKLNPKDEGSNLHGGDFIWVEELLLKDFANG